MSKKRKPIPPSVELAGKYCLMLELAAEGVEVALPERDIGVDLIAYWWEDNHFVVRPIQLKGAEEEIFVLDKKYVKIPSLIMIYAWHVNTENPVFYALTYQEALEVLKQTGAAKSKSWKKGTYSITRKVGGKFLPLLTKFKITKKRQWKKTLETPTPHRSPL